jgi:hypothetical protein
VKDMSVPGVLNTTMDIVKHDGLVTERRRAIRRSRMSAITLLWTVRAD